MADRRRAVLLTAQAQKLEDSDMDKALELAKEAHGLAPDLVPAAEIAGRLAASAGKVGQATHGAGADLEEGAASRSGLRLCPCASGNSPKDRLKRVRELAAKTPSIARRGSRWPAPPSMRTSGRRRDGAGAARRGRSVGARLRVDGPIEKGEKGDTGRVRQWLARAVTAPRDPTWVADNQASNGWAPVSPVTGELDAYEWREAPEPPQRAADAGWLAEIVASAEMEAGR